LNPYFEYFETECREALDKWEGCDISEVKFLHVIKVVQMVKDEKCRKGIEGYLKMVLDRDIQEIIDELVGLAARLFLMVPTSCSGQGGYDFEMERWTNRRGFRKILQI
jgi:hypothetical protein